MSSTHLHYMPLINCKYNRPEKECSKANDHERLNKQWWDPHYKGALASGITYPVQACSWQLCKLYSPANPIDQAKARDLFFSQTNMTVHA